MRIFTHINVDLDAVFSVCAARQFLSGARQAEVIFVPADWNGDGLQTCDLALDVQAGGKGIKGSNNGDGLVHSCFAEVVRRYAPQTDQKALCFLVAFVDAQDTHGSALRFLVPQISAEAEAILAVTGINAVLRAMQSYYHNDDERVCQEMGKIFLGMLRSGRARARAAEEADSNKVDILPGGRVAVVNNAREFGTNSKVFARGVEVIVYSEGNNIGIVRDSNSTFHVDHPTVQAVVNEVGELAEWFAHPSGFFFCRGSRKAPAPTPSKVDPWDLADAVARELW